MNWAYMYMRKETVLTTICIGANGGSPSFWLIGIGRYFVLDTKNLICTVIALIMSLAWALSSDHGSSHCFAVNNNEIKLKFKIPHRLDLDIAHLHLRSSASTYHLVPWQSN